MTTNTNGKDHNTVLNAALALLAVGLVVGLAVSGSVRHIVQTLDPEQHATLVAQQRAMLPVRVVSQVVFRVALFAAGGFGVYRVAVIGLNWLDLKSRQIHAKNGLFPVIRTNAGLYDPNRAMGEHPAVTLSALQVQKQAALTAARVSITLKNDAGALPALLAEDPVLPNIEWPAKVPLRGLLDGRPSINNLVLGVTLDENGQREIVRGTMADLVHVAVGGTSGWGKSVFLKSLAYQLALAEEQPHLCLVDLEGVTLNAFDQCSNLLYPLADTQDAAIAVFQALNGEMERRKTLYNQYKGVDKLAAYNAVADIPLKPIVILVDEATALLDNTEVQNHLKPLALRARKYGLWLILAGQDWKATSLDTAIRNQLSTRIHFKALNGAQSRVLLGQSCAAELTAVGRAYAVLPGRPMLEMQAPFISQQMLDDVGGKGAQRDLPTVQNIPTLPAVLDVTAAPIIEDDPVLPDADRIRLLHTQGLSQADIEQRVFGFSGGSAYRKVKAALE